MVLTANLHFPQHTLLMKGVPKRLWCCRKQGNGLKSYQLLTKAQQLLAMAVSSGHISMWHTDHNDRYYSRKQVLFVIAQVFPKVMDVCKTSVWGVERKWSQEGQVLIFIPCSFFFLLLFSFIYISWRLITLQYCSGALGFSQPCSSIPLFDSQIS